MLATIKYLIAKLLKKALHIPAIRNSTIDKTSRVCSGSHIYRSSMDRYSYVGNFCTVIDTHIGSFCSIADGCFIGGSKHPLEWVSSSPVFHEGRNIMGKNFSTHAFEDSLATTIGNDVWIGGNSLIRGGITVGDGAVIGMGSIVLSDVEPYGIVAGNPARLIRKRFDDDTIQSLLHTRWWDLNDDELSVLAQDIPHISSFISRCRDLA